MKKIFLGLTIIISATSFSQKKNVTNAVMAFDDYNKNKLNDKEAASKDLLEAKEYIDLAAAHEDTQAESKTLYYKGKIYVELSMYANSSQLESLAAFKDEKVMETGFNSLREAKKDPKDRYGDDIANYVNFYRNNLYTLGSAAYSEQKYDVAMAGLLGAAEFGDVAGIVDSSFYFFGGISAFNAEEYVIAQEAFQKCIEINYNLDQSVAYQAQIFQKQGKTAEAEQSLKDAISKYPKNKGLLIELINFYIDGDRDNEALDALNAALELDPKNTALLFNSGAIYENMGDFENAKSAYERLIAIEPEAVRGQFAMGGLYFNKGADLNNAANQLALGDPKYDTMVEESKGYFEKAVPFLEKAAETSPKDRAVLESLMAAYSKTGSMDKFKEIKARIAAL